MMFRITEPPSFVPRNLSWPEGNTKLIFPLEPPTERPGHDRSESTTLNLSFAGLVSR